MKALIAVICIVLCSCATAREVTYNGVDMTYQQCFADEECTAAFEEAHEWDESMYRWTD